MRDRSYSKSNYIKYGYSYSDSVDSGLGSWYGFKSNDLGIMFDVLNNIRLVSYNCDYGVHQPLSLLSLMLNPSIILQSVDKVLDTVHIKDGENFEVGNDDTIVTTKKDLWNAVLKGKKDIYVIRPRKDNGKKVNLIENLKYVMELEEYLTTTIRRLLYILSIRKFRQVIKCF